MMDYFNTFTTRSNRIKPKDGIQSLLKAASVLKSFSLDEPILNASDISRKVGVPKTTAHRILTTLAATGLLEHAKHKGKYMIGPALYAIGNLYLETKDIMTTAAPTLKTLNELTDEAIAMSILEKGNAVLVMKEEPRYPFRFVRHVGAMIPAYSSSMGKALLSELTEAEVDEHIPMEKLKPLTKKTIATKTELKMELNKIRKTGISIDREGSYEGVEAIASAVRDASGKAVTSICIVVPVFRINQANRARFKRLIKLAASHISYRLGYQGEEHPIRSIQQIRSWWEQNQAR